MAVKLSKVTGDNILSGQDSLKTKAILKAWAEEAKKEFAGGAAEYEFEKSMSINGQSYDFNETITKVDFIAAITPLIDRTIATMKQVVEESKTDFDDINRIVLVGGSSKGPWVFDAVKEKMGRDPYVAPNVDTFVAAGASYYGSDIIEGGDDEPIEDKVPMNYGIELDGGTFGPMIIKGEDFVNGVVSRTRHFTNSNDSGQLSLVGWTNPVMMEIVTEGDNLTCEHSIHETDQNGKRLFTWIGEFDVEIPKRLAGTLDIELTMTVYSDKTLQLTGKVDGVSINTENIKWNY